MRISIWFQILIYCLIIVFHANGMLVKSWGTSLKINWLKWSINDIFNEAVELMTLGQRGVHQMQGFKKNLTTNDDTLVKFEAYNGWLEDLRLSDTTTPSGDLRRVIMTRAERYLHEKAAGIKDKLKETGHQNEKQHQHEMIICFECMALSIKSLRYAYRVEMNSTEDSTKDPILLWSAGTLQYQQPMTLPITFQMSIMVSNVPNNINEENHNTTNQLSKKQCTILLEPLQLGVWSKWWPITATKIGRFSFLSDHVEKWLERSFNNGTLKELQSSLDTSVRRVLHTRNICLEILLKDNDYVHD